MLQLVLLHNFVLKKLRKQRPVLPLSWASSVACSLPHSSAWENWVNLDGELCPTYLNPRFILPSHQGQLLKTQENERKIPGSPCIFPWPARVKGIPLEEGDSLSLCSLSLSPHHTLYVCLVCLLRALND